jgi:hypothetical protein
MDAIQVVIIVIVSGMVLVLLWDIGEWIISKLKKQ